MASRRFHAPACVPVVKSDNQRVAREAARSRVKRKTGFWPACFLVEQRLAQESRVVRVPADGYLRHDGCFYRAPLSPGAPPIPPSRAPRDRF